MKTRSVRINVLLAKFILIPALILPIGAFASVPNPVLTGPIICGQSGISCSQASGLLFTSATSNAIVGQALKDANYGEQEYFVEGTAQAYTTTLPLTVDGLWNSIVYSGATSPYKTRIIVRYPMNPKKFNGTVIVEWNNISLGFDTDPQWTKMYSQMLHDGYAFVGVSTQLSGVNYLKSTYDPLRYGSLSHPGDSYSYDIFSQVAQAIRNPVGINALKGLAIKQVIATGLSASADRLVTYYNGIQPRDKEFDGFLINGRSIAASALSQAPFNPAPVRIQYRADLEAPVINVALETDIGARAGAGYYTRQADSSVYRHWEIAGSGHLTLWESNHQSSGPVWWSINSCSQPINDGVAEHYVMDAALYHLNRWVTKGVNPPNAPLLSVAAATFPAVPVINRDSFGNALGGIRTPFLDVPKASYSGTGNTPGGLCGLLGITSAFSDSMISSLYPTHDSYVSPFTAATSSARDAGFLTQPDLVEILHEAQGNK
jgi:hypothetical protein